MLARDNIGNIAAGRAIDRLRSNELRSTLCLSRVGPANTSI